MQGREGLRIPSGGKARGSSSDLPDSKARSQKEQADQGLWLVTDTQETQGTWGEDGGRGKQGPSTGT